MTRRGALQRGWEPQNGICTKPVRVVGKTLGVGRTGGLQRECTGEPEGEEGAEKDSERMDLEALDGHLGDLVGGRPGRGGGHGGMGRWLRCA